MHRAFPRFALLALMLLPFNGAALAQAQKPGQSPLGDMPSYKADVGQGEAPQAMPDFRAVPVNLPYEQAAAAGAPLARPARTGVEIVEATGRAIMMPGRDKAIARRRALSEALYYAAIKSAARVDGFSMIDLQTALNEQVLVQPASDIVDYTILSEGENGDHYEITIRAVAAPDAEKLCAFDHKRRLTVFAPLMEIAPDVPVWATPAARKALASVMQTIERHEKLELRLAMHQELNLLSARGRDDMMDYTSLVSGTRIRPSDYALVPTIEMRKVTSRKYGFVETEAVAMNVRFDIYTGATFEPVMSRVFNASASAGVQSFFHGLNAMSRPGPDDQTRQLRGGLEVMVKETIDALVCQPLKGMLAKDPNDNRFFVQIGSRHGVNRDQLAVIALEERNWTAMQVREVQFERAYVEPLDPTRKLDGLLGMQVRFMETSR